MMDQQKGNFVFECDPCGETLETNTANFNAALNMLKREGWKARKIDDVWTHKCEKCQ